MDKRTAYLAHLLQKRRILALSPRQGVSNFNNLTAHLPLNNPLTTRLHTFHDGFR